MRVVFMYADKDIAGDRELILADHFLEGVAIHGDGAEKTKKVRIVSDDQIPDADVVCLCGVKSARHSRALRQAGKRIIFFDKGYTRHRGVGRTWEYWRVSVDDLHPTKFLSEANCPVDRWEDLAKKRKIRPQAWRSSGEQIVIAGSSAKYHSFHELDDPTSYAKRLIKKLRGITDRPIVYRPKPTWKEATPIKGSIFSPYSESIMDAMQGAWCLLTYGSNATFEAVISGIPAVVIGEAITKPISSTDLADVNDPYLATWDERNKWFRNLAWCQFTEAEMQEGLAWETLRPQLTP